MEVGYSFHILFFLANLLARFFFILYLLSLSLSEIYSLTLRGCFKRVNNTSNCFHANLLTINLQQMLNYYRNCDELPIYNFYKVLEEKDFNYLYPQFDGYNAVKKTDDIDKVWKTIYDEYLDLSGDKTTMAYYELIADIMYLTTRYKVVSALLSVLVTSAMEKEVRLLYIAELRGWDYVINTKNPIEKELEQMVIQLKQSENKIRIKESQLEDLKKENSSNESFTLIQQQVKLEQALSRNEIDVKKVSVSKWIVMMNEVKEIKEQQRKQQRKQQQKNNG